MYFTSQHTIQWSKSYLNNRSLTYVLYLTWNLHIDYFIGKLKCRETCSYLCSVGNNQYGIIPVKPIILCCTVWGHCAKEKLNKWFCLQKRCTTVIVNVKFLDNSMSLFNTKLAWLPIDDTIRTRNLQLLHKICNGNGPIIIFPYYVNYCKSSHGHYNTRKKNDPITPRCKKSSGPRTFNSSVTGLWDGTEIYLRDVLSQRHFALEVFLKDLQRQMTGE